jgi:hypothetical protein
MVKAGVAALGMLALAGTAQAGGRMNGVSEQMQVASSGGKVVLTLSVHNGGAASVFVPKALYQSKQLFNRVFEVREQGGADIDYTGPMVKRGPLTKADFLNVAPGATRSNSIDITHSYAFLPGAHTYQLRYDGNVLASLAKLDEQTAQIKQAPAPVTFSYTGK